MNKRRKTLIALGAGTLLAALPSLAQPSRMKRIGYLGLGNSQGSHVWLIPFREGMAELRWIEGRDYVMDARHAEGVSQAGPGVAAELIAARPDALITPGDVGTRLLVQRTKTIPIVFANSQDPVGNGYAASLQRPGGNVTGITNLARDLVAKRLQLLKESFPRVANVVLLFNSTDAGSAAEVKEIEAAAARLALRVTPIELRDAADIEPAFKRGAALRAHAYIVTSGFIGSANRKAVVDGTVRARVPAMFSSDVSVDAGGLMSYSPDLRNNFRHAAGYIDRILKGAKPGDLPIEQPVKFELVVNLRTAKAIGLTIPESLLLRADRVIE